MVQGRTYSPNHKIKKRIPLPKNRWIIVNDTHKAIISRDIYSKSQDILTRAIKPIRQPIEKSEPSILSGYVYCSDCGGKMLRSSATYNNSKVYRLICSTYKNKGKKHCSSHYIREKKLIDALLATINLYSKIAVDKDFINRIEKKRKLYNISSFFEIKLKKAQNFLDETKMIRQELYKDYKLERITEAEYFDMKISFEQQYNDLLKQIASINKNIELEKKKKMPINEALEYFKIHSEFKKLTRDMVIKLVDRIIIESNNSIKIIFNFEDIFKDYIEKVAT